MNKNHFIFSNQFSHTAMEDTDGINIWGLVSIIIFYLIVLLIGIYAGWKQRKLATDQENVMLAGRNIGLFVGVLTMGGKIV